MLEHYVVSYVKDEAGMSPDTLRAYYAAIEQYVIWLKDTRSIGIKDIDVTHFSKESIKSFLSYIETERRVSVSTRTTAGQVWWHSWLLHQKSILFMPIHILMQRKLKTRKRLSPKRISLLLRSIRQCLNP